MSWPGPPQPEPTAAWPPGPPRPHWSRVTAVLGLVLATFLLLQLPVRLQPESGAGPVGVVPYTLISGDFLYRLGEFVQWQSHSQRDVNWYAGYQYSQMGLGLYERQAVSAHPHPEALLRLGILYSRRGYPEQGREALMRAWQEDPERGGLYLGLVSLYGGPKTAREVADLPGQTQTLPRWLRDMVNADLYRALGQTEAATAAEETWGKHLGTFGVLVAALEVLAGTLALIGLVALLTWLVRQVAEWVGATRPGGAASSASARPPLGVSWSLLEVMEVVAVLVFLLVLASLTVSALQPYLAGGPGWLLPLVQVAAYCLYMGAALLLAYAQVRRGRGTWAALGWRAPALGRLAWYGVTAYGLMMLLAVGASLWAMRYLMATAAGYPLLQGAETPLGLGLLFLLVCVIAPVAEETIFRGFVYPGLRQLFPPGWAALFSGMVFAGAHLPGSPYALGFLAAFGLILAVVYENTRSLVPCIVVHALQNLLAFGVLVAVFAV